MQSFIRYRETPDRGLSQCVAALTLTASEAGLSGLLIYVGEDSRPRELRLSRTPVLMSAVQALREPAAGDLTHPEIPGHALEERTLEPKSPGTVRGQI